ELARNNARLLNSRRPTGNKWRCDAAFVREMLVKQERRVTDICPGDPVTLPHIFGPGINRMVVIANHNAPPVSGSAGNIIPSRLNNFSASAIVRKEYDQRVLFDMFFTQTAKDPPDAPIQVLDH